MAYNKELDVDLIHSDEIITKEERLDVIRMHSEELLVNSLKNIG